MYPGEREFAFFQASTHFNAALKWILAILDPSAYGLHWGRDWISLFRKFYVRTHVNEIDAINGRSRAKVKFEPRSTFTFTHNLSDIASISFTHVNFACVLTEKLRDSGNQP